MYYSTFQALTDYLDVCYWKLRGVTVATKLLHKWNDNYFIACLEITKKIISFKACKLVLTNSFQD